MRQGLSAFMHGRSRTAAPRKLAAWDVGMHLCAHIACVAAACHCLIDSPRASWTCTRAAVTECGCVGALRLRGWLRTLQMGRPEGETVGSRRKTR